jgi:hypothetical protein
MQADQAFAQFLVRAKQNSYAALGGGAAVPPLLPGAHQLEYEEGGRLYRDVYFGGHFFVGQETVYENGVPLWCMGYAGGLVDGVDPHVEAASVYDFLREALRRVGVERPYRGPHTYQQGAYAFSDSGEGHIGNFWGVETVTLDQKTVYRLRYHGGYIRE